MDFCPVEEGVFQNDRGASNSADTGVSQIKAGIDGENS